MKIKQFDIIFSKNIIYVLEVFNQTEDTTTVQSLCIDNNRLYIFPYKIPNKENYKFAVGKYSTLFYEYKNYVIWGITAKILENFLDFIKE